MEIKVDYETVEKALREQARVDDVAYRVVQRLDAARFKGEPVEPILRPFVDSMRMISEMFLRVSKKQKFFPVERRCECRSAGSEE